MLRLSRDRRVLEIYRAIEDLLCYTRDDIFEKTGFSLMHPDHRDRDREQTMLT